MPSTISWCSVRENNAKHHLLVFSERKRSPASSPGVHLRTTSCGPGERGPGERGPGECGPGESGPGERGPGERGPGESGPGECGPVLGVGLQELLLSRVETFPHPGLAPWIHKEGGTPKIWTLRSPMETSRPMRTGTQRWNPLGPTTPAWTIIGATLIKERKGSLATSVCGQTWGPIIWRTLQWTMDTPLSPLSPHNQRTLKGTFPPTETLKALTTMSSQHPRLCLRLRPGHAAPGG
ncbi:hypothetical protein P4O66_006441 [Electrophorus voltai]|uniref:Uncharacterized protein n=1 Tax=Electrophorus voltai TaxID=2609070 RepID=A0AAD9E2C9_9TELE|nr:hypothetical protein P4O66_006441 [Electrophorus voltai]